MIVEPVAVFLAGKVTVSSTVPTPLPASVLVYKPQIGITIRADAGAIYVGNADVTTNFFTIPAAGVQFFPLSTAANLFFLAAANNDKISYLVT